MKKILLGLLTFLLCFTFTAPDIAYSATAKLNKTTLTLNERESFQLKVKGAAGKITWKSYDTSIAAVSDQGLVEGVSEGTTIIVATVKKKNYRCKVTVKDVPTPEELASANFTIDSYETAQGILAFITNDNEENLQANVVLEFYDKDGAMLKKFNKLIYVSEAKKQMAIAFRVFEDGYRFPFYSYKISVQAGFGTKAPLNSYMDKIMIDTTSFPTGHVVNVTITNKAEDTIVGICYTVVFYKDEKIVDAVQQDISNMAKDEMKTEYIVTNMEIKNKKEQVEFDAYKVFINEAYINK